MSANLSIKDVPDDLVERLRDRAKRNHRSIQGELMTILEEALKPQHLSIEEAKRMLEALDFETGPDSVEIIRRERDAR